MLEATEHSFMEVEVTLTGPIVDDKNASEPCAYIKSLDITYHGIVSRALFQIYVNRATSALHLDPENVRLHTLHMRKPSDLYNKINGDLAEWEDAVADKEDEADLFRMWQQRIEKVAGIARVAFPDRSRESVLHRRSVHT